MNQFSWEAWLYVSTTLFILTFILGTLEGSREFLPNYLWYFALVTTNLLICIGVGLKKR